MARERVDSTPCTLNKDTHLDIVDVHLPIFTELECAFAFLLSKGIRLVDLRILWELAVRFYCF
jgi:hypothetical protein